ncbi:hypothetical protein [Catellatospora paridis]|uniref:hypothetical protein n=1 Tax=Catellatospora paridis TaxID=1617086 RepID=UPI0012D413D0|nr:hypothetical protein [Catellatospora paridis]
MGQDASQPIILIIDGSKAARYGERAHAYDAEHDAAYERERVRGDVSASNWHAMTGLAEEFAGDCAHLCTGALPALPQHIGDDGRPCPWSGALFDADEIVCPRRCRTISPAPSDERAVSLHGALDRVTAMESDYAEGSDEFQLVQLVGVDLSDGVSHVIEGWREAAEDLGHTLGWLADSGQTPEAVARLRALVEQVRAGILRDLPN